MEQAVMETVGSELVNLSIRWKIFELIDTARSCATKAQAQAQGQCDKYRKDLVDDINYLSVKLRYCEGRNQAELGPWRMAGLEETLEMSEKVVGECVELLKDNVPLFALNGPNPANRLKVLLSCIDMKIQDYEVWRKLEGIRRSLRLNTRSKKDQESAVADADTGVVMFTWAELLAGCNNWFVNNKLNNGRHGCKYWGVLPKGRLVAVKRIDDEAVMLTELKVIPHPRDGHFARVLGYYADKREHLLVTEYMPNGSLYAHLHPLHCGQSNSPVISSWKTRLGIALGVASAIDYLQRCYSSSPIVHTDIASRHILLDEEFMPRLSGLGSATWPERRLSRLGSLGTAGYLDPDYDVHKGYMTPASDVYSFGVLLAELLTGKDPFELYRKNDHILNYINVRDRDQLWKALDRRPPARLELVQALLPLGDTLKGCLAKRRTISNVMSDIEAVLANLPQG